MYEKLHKKFLEEWEKQLQEDKKELIKQGKTEEEAENIINNYR